MYKAFNGKAVFLKRHTTLRAPTATGTVMKVLSNPWQEDFLRLVSAARFSIKITAPFVKWDVCEAMLQAKRSTAAICLITNFRLKSVLAGAIDLSALEAVLDNNGAVRSFPRLHSKIYLFDDVEAVITSANLTHGGLVGNFEYGLHINEPEVVARIVSDFDQLLTDERTGKVDRADLDAVSAILNQLPQPQEQKRVVFDLQTPEEGPDVLDITAEPIARSLSGWLLEVFKCVDAIPDPIFTLSDAYAYERILKEKYPQNEHIADKIRQQLQALRDLGLIEFLGNGRYRKLWK